MSDVGIVVLVIVAIVCCVIFGGVCVVVNAYKQRRKEEVDDEYVPITPRYSMAMRQMITCAEVEYFLNDIEEVFNRHNLCLSHEDTAGAFVVERKRNYYTRWFKEAHIGNSIIDEEGRTTI